MLIGETERALLLLSLLLPAGPGRAADRHAPNRSSAIAIYIHNYARVDQDTVGDAKKEVARILRRTGAETLWAATSGESAPRLPSIDINVIPSSMSNRLTLPPGVSKDALGFTPGVEPDRKRARVFYNRVEATTAPAERTVTVYAVDNGVNTRGVLYQAQQRAAKMFAEVGVRLDWRTGRPSGTRAQRDLVIVVSLAEHPPAGYSPEALASAKVYEGVHISVFWDRVAGLSRFAPLAVVLAHVLVHEITHILQGIDRHSETGVMKAQWTPEDFHAMLSKPLPFTALDVQLIRLGLAPLVDREAKAMGPANSAPKPTD